MNRMTGKLSTVPFSLTMDSLTIDRVGLTRRHRGKRRLLHFAEPEFKEQELPQPGTVVAASALVFFEQIAQEGGRDHSPAEETRAGEMVPEHFSQGSAEPGGQGHTKTHLGAAQQGRRQAISQGAKKNSLALAVAQLPGVRNAGCEFSQLMIEQRAAHFK